MRRGPAAVISCLPGSVSTTTPHAWRGIATPSKVTVNVSGTSAGTSIFSRGTLSAEERYKINEHIVQTIVMLTQLPFPRHLQSVPEIAGGHHEKMDGTGYPRGLKREEMSPVARMMAIADIFEALTAADRPYKSGKTLSQALAIMARMRNDQHIDPELFELFLRSGVYRENAGRFMRAEQIDEVVIEDYLQAA